MKKRVLFIPEGVTLAHVGRMLRLAAALDQDRFDIDFAVAARHAALVRQAGFHQHDIVTITGERFTRALEYGLPMYSRRVLQRYVNEESELFARVSPGLVVGDFRLSLALSAAKAGCPYINLVNAYWSACRRFQDYPMPDSIFTRLFGYDMPHRLLWHWLRPIVMAGIVKPFNQLAQSMGLPAFADLHALYTSGDHVLYADLPELVPADAIPPHHRFLGPVLWSPDVPEPSWWNDLPTDKPIIYLTLGSSGASRTLPAILEGLSTLPVTVMLATAGARICGKLPDIVYAADYLPGEQCAARASLVINNSGSGGVYQALAAGRPVLGIPSNMDQYLSIEHVVRAGCGCMIRSSEVTPESIRETVRRMLADTGMQLPLAAMHHRLMSWHSETYFTAMVDEVLQS